jgi:hypothetical protein
MPLDGEHLCRKLGQHGGGVARPGADFQHTIGFF